MIQLDCVTKSFGTTRALDGLSLAVRPGEIFGLLGPNGAGKTTTIRLLNGLFPPDSGSLSVFGMDPQKQGSEIRARAGILTETPALYERLSAEENLLFFGNICGISQQKLVQRVFEVLDLFGLEARAKERVAGFSKGMKQRVALARALLHNPELLFLDEPTSSLDPESALQVNDLIRTISRDGGRTIFLCTHNLLEAQRLCDRVAVLDAGKILASGTPAELAAALFPGVRVEIDMEAPAPVNLAEKLTVYQGLRSIQWEGGTALMDLADHADIPGMVATLVSAGARITRVEPRPVSLEEIYFQLRKNRGGHA